MHARARRLLLREDQLEIAARSHYYCIQETQSSEVASGSGDPKIKSIKSGLLSLPTVGQVQNRFLINNVVAVLISHHVKLDVTSQFSRPRKAVDYVFAGVLVWLFHSCRGEAGRHYVHYVLHRVLGPGVKRLSHRHHSHQRPSRCCITFSQVWNNVCFMFLRMVSETRMIRPSLELKIVPWSRTRHPRHSMLYDTSAWWQHCVFAHKEIYRISSFSIARKQGNWHKCWSCICMMSRDQCWFLYVWYREISSYMLSHPQTAYAFSVRFSSSKGRCQQMEYSSSSGRPLTRTVKYWARLGFLVLRHCCVERRAVFVCLQIVQRAPTTA